MNNFDVNAFVRMVIASGTGWGVFKTAHGKYYFPGPLRVMDRVLLARTCQSDLIGELADAPSRLIRLLLYFASGPGSKEDPT